MEFNDIYDEHRQLTGRVHKRGMPWKEGEYGLVVCVWIYDGKGNILMTRRAPEKSYPGTWENSGGAAKAGETSRVAILRELYEETGILAAEQDFELLTTVRDKSFFYDHYCLRADTPLEQIKLLPGETDDVKWVTFAQIHEMIKNGMICDIIAQQFLHEEPELLKRQDRQNTN